MVWLLDKPFRFVTAYSWEECAALLEKLNAKIQHDLHNKQVIHFSMKRVAGRGLVVRVKGTFQDKYSPDGILVSGYGRVSLGTVTFLTYYLIMSMFFAIALRAVPILSFFVGLGTLMSLYFGYLSVKKRNELIRIVVSEFMA